MAMTRDRDKSLRETLNKVSTLCQEVQPSKLQCHLSDTMNLKIQIHPLYINLFHVFTFMKVHVWS